MKLVTFSIFGIILQGVWLVAFILISRTTFADLGKPIVISIACLSVAFLLWRGVRSTNSPTSLCLLPVVLAIGYIIAFHLVGMIGFPGLIRDIHTPYSEYLWSLLRVAVVLLFVYGAVTTLLFGFDRVWHRARKTE
jgi:hypothetical protein